MNPQSYNTHNLGIFGTPTWNSKKFNNLNVTSTTIHKIYYKKGSGTFSKGSKQC